MTHSQIKNIFFTLCACLLFFIELSTYATLHRYDFYFQLCFFILLLTNHAQRRTLLAPLLFMSILSYLEVNIFGWSLVYCIPTITIAHFLDQHLRIKIIIPYALLICSFALKLVLGWYLHGIAVSWLHILQIITYNTSIITIGLAMSSYLEKNKPLNNN